MVNNKNIIIVLCVLLILSVGMAAYGLLSKGKAIQSVAMVIQGKDFNYVNVNEFDSVPFWDNYPYWIFLNRGKKIDSALPIQDFAGLDHKLKDLLTRGYRLVFRYSSQANAILNDTTLYIMKQLKAKVIILLDNNTRRVLQYKNIDERIKKSIYFMQSPLTLSLEKSKLSYFFVVANDNIIKNIYFPRIETPEITIKYIIANNNQQFRVKFLFTGSVAFRGR